MPEVSVNLIETGAMPNLAVWAVYDSPDTVVTALRMLNPYTTDCTMDFHPQHAAYTNGMGPARFQWQLAAGSELHMVPPDSLKISWSDSEHIEGHHTIYSQQAGFDPQTSEGELFARCHSMA